MFGLGMGEIIVLAVLGLILIGPDQLPEIARTLGRFLNDFKRATEGLTDDLKKQAKIDLNLDVESSSNKVAKLTNDQGNITTEPAPEAVPIQRTFSISPETLKAQSEGHDTDKEKK